MDTRNFPPYPFPCNEVPFDPQGPYAIDKTLLDDNQLSIWSASCKAGITAHQTEGFDRLYYEFGIRQPALLVKRGWCYINLFAEADGVALLEEAQRIVGEGKDKLFDKHLGYLRKYVQHLLEDHDKAWDTLEDPETEWWHRKWVPLRPKPVENPVSEGLETLLSKVQAEWEDLQNTLSPTEAVLRYNRLLSIQTNQLEGLFLLKDESISRLVRSGFVPSAVQPEKRGSLYFEIPKNEFFKDKSIKDEFIKNDITHVCNDILKAIEIVVSQSQNKMPIDIASINKIHFESIYHSRFMLIEEDPPTLAAIFPGTFRQSVCSTYRDDDQGKTGVVQFCHFRKIPEQMERLLTLFNEYLLGMGPTPSPMDALRIAAWSHAWFVLIHPFGDGNGRVGRLLSSIPLLKCGLPPITIMGSSTLEDAKKVYIDALVQGQQDDNFTPLVEVFLKGMLESLAYIRLHCHEPQ